MNTINKRSFSQTTASNVSQLFRSTEFNEKYGNAEYEIEYRLGTNDRGLFEYQIKLVKVKEMESEISYETGVN